MRDVKVAFVEDLNYDNYKYYVDVVLSNVTAVVRVFSLDRPTLSRLSKVSLQTLDILLRGGDTTRARFTTINKLNNFVETMLLRGDEYEGKA